MASPDVEIATSIRGHNKVIKQDNSGQCYHTPTVAKESGTVEGWIMTTHTDEKSVIYLRDGALNNNFGGGINSDGFNDDKFIYLDNGGWNVLCDVSPGFYYRFRIDFECGAGGYLGLAADTFNIYVYDKDGDLLGSALGKTFGTVCANIETILLAQIDVGYDTYWDAIGFSWDGYTPGDNVSDISDITDDIKDAKIEEVLYMVSPGEITIRGDIFSYQPGHEIDFYDKDSILSWIGIILTPELTLSGTTTYVSKVKLVGISSYFDAIYRKNYTTVRDSDYIIKNIIDNFLTRYHSYGTLIDNFTITYKYDLKKPILKMMYYLAMLERGVLHQLPAGEVFFNKYDNLKSINDGYYYNKPDSLNDEDTGDKASLDEIAWIDSHTLYDGEAEIVESWQGHKNVLRLLDDATPGEDPEVVHNMTQATSGTIELWGGTNDVTKRNDIILLEGGATKLRLSFRLSKLQYMDSGAAWQDILDPAVNDTLYHIKIIWRADNTFDLYLNEVKEVDNQALTANQVSGINRIRIRNEGDSTTYFYLDAPSNIADDFYEEGDNLGFTILYHATAPKLKITKYIPAANRFITRAPVIGGYNSDGQVYVVGVSASQVAEEDQFGIRQLQLWRDTEITNYTEANQLATNLQAIYSIDTQFIHLLSQNRGHFQVGYTMKIRSEDIFAVVAEEFLILGRIWYPTTDLTELLLSDNILSEAKFNARVVQKLYDIDAQQSFEDPDIAESSADGVVIPLVSVALLRSTVGITANGHKGTGTRMINKTGVPSVKGSIVKADIATDFGFVLTAGSDTEGIGIVFDDGIPDGSYCLIITDGIAAILLKDATLSTRGNWAMTSDVAGRADMTGASPAASPQHFKEVGHCIETKVADTDVLAEAAVHFL